MLTQGPRPATGVLQMGVLSMSFLFLLTTLQDALCHDLQDETPLTIHHEQGHHDRLLDDRHLQVHQKELSYLDMASMEPDEEQFHAFLLHDYDADLALDGLEILQALRHMNEVAPEEELVQQVDDLLQRQDTNCDGFLAYHEYMTYLREQNQQSTHN